MCTVTLSYNKNNKDASEKLAALLATGLFEELGTYENLDIDYSDASLYEDEDSLPAITKDLTPEELEHLIIEDIHSIYSISNAV